MLFQSQTYNCIKTYKMPFVRFFSFFDNLILSQRRERVQRFQPLHPRQRLLHQIWINKNICFVETFNASRIIWGTLYQFTNLKIKMKQILNNN